MELDRLSNQGLVYYYMYYFSDFRRCIVYSLATMYQISPMFSAHSATQTLCFRYSPMYSAYSAIRNGEDGLIIKRSRLDMPTSPIGDNPESERHRRQVRARQYS